MEILLDDYKRKLENVNNLIKEQNYNGSIVHIQRKTRLETKASEYRSFIVDIERAIKRQEAIRI